MALASGTHLGPYEIVISLGAGGMGEVYKARDPRLGRDVAIKVLPADKLADPARRARFLQEARAASALSHPNIVTIHEIERDGDVDFLVMEHVAGRTLDAIIPRHGMRVSEALRIAIPIADALATAHAAGIVHRDLKPANVMLAPDGTVKVLDFGLAKVLHRQEPRAECSSTLEAHAGPVTAVGTVAGTHGYMSPEQAIGAAVDVRSDIFSFGALLYELLTGQRAFRGASNAEGLAAIPREQPTPPRQVAPDVPPELERVVLRCLRKDASRRFQSMGDVRIELQELKEEFDSGAAVASAAAPRRARVRWMVTGVGVVLGLAGVGWLLHSARRPEVPPITVEPLTTLPGSEHWPALSPDGRQVVFGWKTESSDNWDLYLKLVGSSDVRRLTTDPADDTQPSWSPNGLQIAFRRTTKDGAAIRLVSPLGGQEQKVTDFPASGGQLAWSPDGRFIAAARPDADGAPRGIYALPVHGGKARLLTHPTGSKFDLAPAFSPDGRRLAYFSCVSEIDTVACDVFVADVDRDLASAAPPRQLTHQLLYMQTLAWTSDGQTILYDTTPFENMWRLWRIRSDGSSEPEPIEVAGRGYTPATSPAVPGIVAFVRTQTRHVIGRLTRGGVTESLAVSSIYDGEAQYSPDGSRIAFTSARSGEAMEVWLAAADGSAPVQLTKEQGRPKGSPRWSPDGERIAFDEQGADGHWDIWTVDVEGGTPTRLTADPGDENVPGWSRDGRWVYFTAMREGRRDVWRIAASGGVEEQVTTGGSGFNSFESLDGKTLFYSAARGDAPLLAVPLGGGTPRRVLGCVRDGGFRVTRRGLYYVPCGSESRVSLHFIDSATGRDEEIGVLENPWPNWFNLSVSPDDNAVLYTVFKDPGRDLMSIKNFR